MESIIILPSLLEYIIPLTHFFRHCRFKEYTDLLEKQSLASLSNEESAKLEIYEMLIKYRREGYYDGVIHVIGSREPDAVMNNSLTLSEMMTAARLNPGEVAFEQYGFSFIGGVGVDVSYTKFIDSEGNISTRFDIQPGFGLGVGGTYTFGTVDTNGRNATDINFDASLSYGAGFFSGVHNFQQDAPPSGSVGTDIVKPLVDLAIPGDFFVVITASGSIIPWDLYKRNVAPTKQDREFIQKLRERNNQE